MSASDSCCLVIWTNTQKICPPVYVLLRIPVRFYITQSLLSERLNFTYLCSGIRKWPKRCNCV